jgi:hypothetical protein
MCTYKGSDSLQVLNENIHYSSTLNLFNVAGFFQTWQDAYNWLLSNGQLLSNKFYELHQQGCAFVIIKQTNLTVHLMDNEYIFNYSDLYILNLSINHYVFNEESYQMCLKEHLLYFSSDWAELFPIWIKYIHNDNIIIGCDINHIKKVHKTFTYSENDLIQKKNDLKMIKKYVQTNDLTIYTNNQLPSDYLDLSIYI